MKNVIPISDDPVQGGTAYKLDVKGVRRLQSAVGTLYLAINGLSAQLRTLERLLESAGDSMNDILITFGEESDDGD